ncbi:hypothetical protein [Priestia megaterium]|uniref:hypothetical protein n=1 Tax=Priestia megaterium TaxID=1404 RepID=UPI000BFE2550|nr:hypothetical protein [Priestia megaterium]PGQ88192.1 hypothetical protein COA18_04510 [Priestia megaterium]
MAEKQIRNKGFSIAVRTKIEEKHPELLEKYKDGDIQKIVECALEVLSELLRSGYRIIFEGYFSFFTKPIKRKCSNLHTNETWWTYKRRIRVKPMDHLKEVSEVEITEEEYKQYIEETEKRKQKKSTNL